MMEVLADGYDRLGLFQVGEPLARDALALRRSTLPAGHPDVASSLNTYGWILHELGRSADAEPLLREAVAIRRAAGEEQIQNLSRSLNDLGVILTARERYPEASEVLTEALEMRRADTGDRSRSVGITASNLAAVHYYQGRLDDAVRVQTIALEALRKAVGDDHQRSIIALSNLANFKRAGGDWDGAIHEFRDLAERQTRLQGRGHLVTTRVLVGLSITLYQQGVQLDDRAMIEEGEALFRETVANFEATLGTNDSQVGIQLYRLALAESTLGRNDDAVDHARRSLAILRASLGDQHASTAQARTTLAVVLARAGRLQEAVSEQRAALAVFESAAPNSLESAAARSALCDLLLTGGNTAEAVALCEQADATLRDMSRPDRYALPLVRLRLANAYLAQGRRAAADSLAGEVRRSFDAGLVSAPARRSLDSLTTRLTSGR
jgi:tetratricopeptide (TPR) repeat protein